MITQIARKELTGMLRDGRLRIIAVLLFLLLLTSLFLGWKSYEAQSAERNEANAASRRQWEDQGDRNPHGAAHFGVYVFKPERPLSLADKGVDAFTGISVWLEAHSQNPFRYRPAEDATALQRFGELTAANTLQLLVPLFIIILCFSAFSGEREDGTLRQVLSLGVSPTVLALGKALGVVCALGVFLIPATIIGVIALRLAGGAEFVASDLPNVALMTLGYLLYFGAFIGVSLLVSAVSSSSRIALVVLLGFWILNGLLMPRLTADFAERIYPTPSTKDFWEAVNKEIKEGVDGHNSADTRTADLKKKVLEQYKVSKVEDLPVNFDGIALQTSEEHGNEVFDKHYGALWNTYAAQDGVYRLTAWFAPYLAVRSFSMSLAGTDFENHRHFAVAAETYRREMVKKMNDDVAFNSRSGDWEYKQGKSLWQSVPPFSYQKPDTLSLFKSQLTNLLTLAVWCLVCFAGAIFAARKISV